MMAGWGLLKLQLYIGIGIGLGFLQGRAPNLDPREGAIGGRDPNAVRGCGEDTPTNVEQCKL